MKKQLLYFSFFLSINSFSQTPSVAWQKCYGGSGSESSYSVKQTKDGGYILTGWSDLNDGDITGNHGSDDVWILKTNSTGSIDWSMCYGGTGEEYAYAIQQTSDEGYVFVGRTNSNDGNVSGNHGNDDVWVVKLDSVGTVEWQKCYGGTNKDVAYSINHLPDDGYIIGGKTLSNDVDVSGNHGSEDVWLIKINSSGNIEWSKCYGGLSNDYMVSSEPTIDGGYVFTGITSSTEGDVSSNNGGEDLWVVKLNSTGVIDWQKSIGGSVNDFAHSIKQTADSGFVTLGWTKSNDGDVTGNHGNTDAWVVKLNSTGGIQWQKCYGGSGFDYTYSIQQTSEKNFVFVGYTNSSDGDVVANHSSDWDAWFVQTDSLGSINWQKCLGGSSGDWAYSFDQTIDGGYIVAGDSYSNNGDISGNHSGGDIILIKLDIPLGIDKYKKEDLVNVYPNPTSGKLIIENEKVKMEKVEIFNILGERVYEEVISDKQTANSANSPNGFSLITIDLSSNPNGVYFMQIQTSDGKIIEKVVKN